jgi:CRP-like cAMP-binding protein
LDALSPEGLAAFADSLEVIPLAARDTIYDSGSTTEMVYFPIDCVISVVTAMRDGSAIETVTIGYEGMCGAQSALGSSQVFGRWFCQIPGRAYRMDTALFLSRYAVDDRLRLIVGRYLAALIDVLAQSVACNRLHLVSERCARWLLTTHDRVKCPDFPLTHEALATMLGVRRAGVSIAAAALQNAGFISYKRGRFHVANVEGLGTAACECYGVTRNIYDRWALHLDGAL